MCLLQLIQKRSISARTKAAIRCLNFTYTLQCSICFPYWVSPSPNLAWTSRFSTVVYKVEYLSLFGRMFGDFFPHKQAILCRSTTISFIDLLNRGLPSPRCSPLALHSLPACPHYPLLRRRQRRPDQKPRARRSAQGIGNPARPSQDPSHR
jgi:hypothetical protein